MSEKGCSVVLFERPFIVVQLPPSEHRSQCNSAAPRLPNAFGLPQTAGSGSEPAAQDEVVQVELRADLDAFELHALTASPEAKFTERIGMKILTKSIPLAKELLSPGEPCRTIFRQTAETPRFSQAPKA